MRGIFTHCHNCNRGGRGNDVNKCSSGFKVTKKSDLGCYLGTPIVGEPNEPKKLSKSKEKYQKYLEYGDCFNSFMDFIRWYDLKISKGEQP